MNRLNNFVLVLLLVSLTSHADEKSFLTVDELVKHGYTPLSGQKIVEIMNDYEIRVVDIETEAVSISTKENQTGIDRAFKEAKSNKTSYFLDSRLLARAPPLEGKITRKVVDDQLIATDGVRSYSYTIYEKDGGMFAVRDIDAGSVFFEVQLE